MNLNSDFLKITFKDNFNKLNQNEIRLEYDLKSLLSKGTNNLW